MKKISRTLSYLLRKSVSRELGPKKRKNRYYLVKGLTNIPQNQRMVKLKKQLKTKKEERRREESIGKISRPWKKKMLSFHNP